MKLSLKLFFLFLFVLAKGQNTSGVATYKILILTEHSLWNKPDAPADLKEMLKNTDHALITLEPRLSFDKNATVFSIPTANLSDIQKLAARLSCNCYQPIYTDLLKKVTVQFNNPLIHLGIKEAQYILTDSVKTKWQIYRETKKINDYTCYKATLLEKMNTGKTNEITAWFCPEIPVSSGPEGYGGLPGLIFEWQNKNVVMGLTEIHFNDSVTITLPNTDKAQKISSADFNMLISQRSTENSNYTESLEGKR